jgi:hypothetical protein
MPPADLLANITGVYCTANTSSSDAMTVRIEAASDVDGVAESHQRLVWRPASSKSHNYPFVLQWLGWEADLDDNMDGVADVAEFEGKGKGVFRKVMGPEK